MQPGIVPRNSSHVVGEGRGAGDHVRAGNPDLVAGNHRRVGEEDECAGQQGGIQEVVAGAAEDLLAEKYREDRGHCDNPQRHVGRHDHRNEEARDEEALRHLLTPYLREEHLHG